MDDLLMLRLMLRGEERRCADCGTVTIFLPVDAESDDCDPFDEWSDDWSDGSARDWFCTACNGAVTVLGSAA